MTRKILLPPGGVWILRVMSLGLNLYRHVIYTDILPNTNKYALRDAEDWRLYFPFSWSLFDVTFVLFLGFVAASSWISYSSTKVTGGACDDCDPSLGAVLPGFWFWSSGSEWLGESWGIIRPSVMDQTMSFAVRFCMILDDYPPGI